MQRIENNQNQTQKSYQGVNKPYSSNNSLKSKLTNLQNKVNSLRQPGVDSSNNNIQYLGNSKSVNKQSEQNNLTFQQAIKNAKDMRGNSNPTTDMNKLFTSLDNGEKPIVRVNNFANGDKNSNLAVVNSIRGNSVELFDSSQEKPIIMSLRQLYNAINPKNESNST